MRGIRLRNTDCRAITKQQKQPFRHFSDSSLFLFLQWVFFRRVRQAAASAFQVHTPNSRISSSSRRQGFARSNSESKPRGGGDVETRRGNLGAVPTPAASSNRGVGGRNRGQVVCRRLFRSHAPSISLRVPLFLFLRGQPGPGCFTNRYET